MAVMDQLAEFVYETDFHDIPEETVAFTKFLASKIVAAVLLGAKTRAGGKTIEYVSEHRANEAVGIIGHWP